MRVVHRWAACLQCNKWTIQVTLLQLMPEDLEMTVAQVGRRQRGQQQAGMCSYCCIYTVCCSTKRGSILRQQQLDQHTIKT